MFSSDTQEGNIEETSVNGTPETATAKVEKESVKAASEEEVVTQSTEKAEPATSAPEPTSQETSAENKFQEVNMGQGAESVQDMLENMLNEAETLPEETTKEPEEPKKPVQEDIWEDPFKNIDAGNAVKKYVVYISKDFVDTLDSLDSDSRNAYINEALQLKTDTESNIGKVKSFKKITKHVIIVLLTVIIGTPIVFFVINKSIDMTFSSYHYIQSNFENLYREKAEKDRALHRIQRSR